MTDDELRTRMIQLFEKRSRGNTISSMVLYRCMNQAEYLGVSWAEVLLLALQNMMEQTDRLERVCVDLVTHQPLPIIMQERVAK